MLMPDEHDSVLAIFFGKGSARKLAKGFSVPNKNKDTPRSLWREWWTPENFSKAMV
jgi:hypothetical protein